jgi:predicted DNA binding CopG/RHH family protein
MRLMERKKTGRPSKGDRRHVSFRLPTPLIAAMQTRAAQKGMTVTDLVGELVAAEIGMPYQTQEGLPLTKAS